MAGMTRATKAPTGRGKGEAMKHWMLDEKGEPKRAEDIIEWARWLERNQDARRVAFDEIGDVHVSTVFLSIDHAFTGGPPVLWETMVFGGPRDEEQERYTSRADAVAGHARMVARVRASTN